MVRPAALAWHHVGHLHHHAAGAMGGLVLGASSAQAIDVLLLALVVVVVGVELPEFGPELGPVVVVVVLTLLSTGPIVVLLVGYHHACGSLLKKFERGANQRSHKWYRWFNEVPVLGLLAAVLLVVIKPF